MPLHRRTNTIPTQPIQQLFHTSPVTRFWRHRLMTDKVPWEDLKGEVHQPKRCKTWKSFLECVTFHLQNVFCHNTGDLVKYYITNMLKKPNRVPVIQFLCISSRWTAISRAFPICIWSSKGKLGHQMISATWWCRSHDTLVVNVPCQMAETVWSYGEIHSTELKEINISINACQTNLQVKSCMNLYS